MNENLIKASVAAKQLSKSSANNSKNVGRRTPER